MILDLGEQLSKRLYRRVVSPKTFVHHGRTPMPWLCCLRLSISKQDGVGGLHIQQQTLSSMAFDIGFARYSVLHVSLSEGWLDIICVYEKDHVHVWDHSFLPCSLGSAYLIASAR